MKKYEVEDNPFDVLLYLSMELTRDLLFASHRLKDPELENFCANFESINQKVKQICEVFTTLENMSDKTVQLCKETSYYYPQYKFDKLNCLLLESENKMETLYTRSNPARNDRFEQVRLGEESEQYKRMCELRNLIDFSGDFSNINLSTLYILSDILYGHIDQTNIDEEKYYKLKKLIDKYELCKEDINYMCSYLVLTKEE